ncbi:hypothetical protein ACFL58_04610 [Elusimicrobiota bacterium]
MGIKTTIIFFLFAAQLNGLVLPIFSSHQTAINSGIFQNEIGLHDIGGISGLITVVGNSMSQTVRAIAEVSGLVPSAENKDGKKPAKENEKPVNDVIFGVNGLNLNNSFKQRLSNSNGSETTSVSGMGISLCVATFFVMLFLRYIFKIKKRFFHCLLARGSIEDSIIKYISKRILFFARLQQQKSWSFFIGQVML